MNAAAELQKAVFTALGGNEALSALVGDRIFDHVPVNADFPYVSFGRTSVFDWSTGTEDGSEQLFTLHVWSKGRGRKQALEIMELAQQALHDASLHLETHLLVNLRLEFSEVRHDERNEAHHGLLRFRAVTEPA